MSDIRELLRPGVEGYEPQQDAFERVLVRRDRKRRNQRVAAGFIGVAVFILLGLWLVRSFAPVKTPAGPQPETQSSRNGKWVVISAGHLDPHGPDWSRGRHPRLFVAGPGGSARPLAGTPGGNISQGCPAFSPDGSLLAYGQKRGGETSLLVGGFSSSGELVEPEISIPVKNSRSFVRPCPVWAPNGRRLATIAPGLGVLIADLNGTAPLVRVDTTYALREGGSLDLEWSPDGSQLALLTGSSYADREVWVIPADGGTARFLYGTQYIEDIAWTDDGSSVVAVGESCCSDSNPYVAVVDVETGGVRDVPLPDRWSSSGIMDIVASRDDRVLLMRGWESRLVWLDLQGNVAPLHRLEYPLESFPELSPDGKQLLYVTYDPEFGPQQTLIAVPLDGGAPTTYSPSTRGFGDNYAKFAWQPR